MRNVLALVVALLAIGADAQQFNCGAVKRMETHAAIVIDSISQATEMCRVRDRAQCRLIVQRMTGAVEDFTTDLPLLRRADSACGTQAERFTQESIDAMQGWLENFHGEYTL